ncbi:MAG: glutamine amidotransferase [bacterium]|nr:glutamine amidotransferase [bacterium]
MSLELVICHLYPDLMNLYGDRGNISVLVKRAQWRGIDVKVISVSIGDDISSDVDFFFMGGGQDREQRLLAPDLVHRKGDKLRKLAEEGVVFLGICGGYQLFGHYYKPKNNPRLEGIGILDVYTEAGDKRFIGNVFARSKLSGYEDFTLVGFENHSGRTYLSRDANPLGEIIKGYGNNGTDKFEGAWQRNVFGTYLHGPLLPKNPWFADFLLEKALSNKYGNIKLSPLDDTLELKAHKKAIEIISR